MSQSETIVGLGARTDYLAQVPHSDPSRLRLTAEEGQLFQAVGRVARIDDIIHRSGLEEARAIALLLSLRAKGAVVPARVNGAPASGPVDAAMAEEVDLPDDRKKEILDLERALDRLNHFEVLGLPPGSPPEQVKQAYYAASRRYHPDRFYGKNLGSFKYRIDRIFKRLTESSTTLTDPDKRRAYLAQHPELAGPGGAASPGSSSGPANGGGSLPPRAELDPARAAERRARMARHPYLLRNTRLTELLNRARAHIARDEPGMALTDLHLAAQLEPDNKEVQRLQAEARRRNDAQRAAAEVARAAEAETLGDLHAAASRYRSAANIDVHNARAAFKAAQLMRQLGLDPKEVRQFAQRAVDLEPRNVEAKVLLGTVLAEADMKKLAKRQLEEALQIKPDHPEAKRLLKKLRWPF